MIILGLDPGIARTGYGVLDTSKPQVYVRCGCLTSPSSAVLEERLYMLANDISVLIAETSPDIAVVEQIFFGNNKKTAIQTAHVRGMIMVVLRQHNITIQSLTPLQIKSRLTGYGSASKEQIQYMVQKQLNLSAVPTPDDAADALAAALCAA